MKDYLNDFGDRLSELMNKNSLTTRKLAEAINCSNSSISDWSSGKGKIQLENALKLCDYFKCSLNYIVGLTDKMLDFTPQPALPFYERLRFVMTECNITRYRIVKDTRVADKQFDQWKKGSDPQLLTVYEIAKYLDVTLDYLVGRER